MALLDSSTVRPWGTVALQTMEDSSLALQSKIVKLWKEPRQLLNPLQLRRGMKIKEQAREPQLDLHLHLINFHSHSTILESNQSHLKNLKVNRCLTCLRDHYLHSRRRPLLLLPELPQQPQPLPSRLTRLSASKSLLLDKNPAFNRRHFWLQVA